MTRAVFFDFDHTLFSHRTMSIPQSAKDSIKALQARGIRCVLATGRHMLELKRFPDLFTVGLDGYVTIDGQLCLDRDGSVICSEEIGGQALENLVDLFNRKEVAVILAEADRMYGNVHTREAVQGLSYASTVDHPIGEYKGDPVYLGVVYITPEQEEWLHGMLPGCSFLRWSTVGVDVVPEGRDKVSGIYSYLDHYGIDRGDFMAFGDGDNDRAMLRCAPVGVAMGNAWESAKKEADYITTDIDDDGIRNALLHFGLI